MIFLVRTRATVLEARDILGERFSLDAPAQAGGPAARQPNRFDWLGTVVNRIVGRQSEEPRPPEPPATTASNGVQSTALWQHYVAGLRGRRYWPRILGISALFFAFNSVIIRIFEQPSVPYRGHASLMIDQVLLLAIAVPLTIVLIFAVADAIRQCDRFTDALATTAQTTWPEGTLRKFADRLRVPEEDLAGWIDVRFIAEWTARISPLIYYPSIVVVLMIVARSTIFDNWHTPLGLLVVFGLSLLYTVASAFILRRAAERTRQITLRDLTERLINASRDGDSGRGKQLELLIEEVQATREGAFAPFSQQPLVRAALLPLSGAGGAALLQALMSY